MQNLPIIPGRGLVTKLSTQLRHDFLRSIEIDTDKISSSQIDIQDIQSNIESYIGSAEVPIGVVGPLLFNDTGQQEFVYCAAGTLEGALVASMNRGAKALSQSGGFFASINWQRMTRVPMFLFETEMEAIIFKSFVSANFEDIKKVAEMHSNHAILLDIQVVCMQTTVHLKFNYSTGDASGQNMTTTCTWHAILHVADRFKNEKGITPVDFVIEGNGAADKKISDHNITSGRGTNVTAQCFLSEKVIVDILRTTSEKLIRCFYPAQQQAKSIGMVGFNINVANAIAAIYVATGQDLASIHESGVGILHVNKVAGGLELKLNLPNLVIGTVGGGTHLPKQSQALSMMKCLGSGKAERFAKLIAGFALGLEISTYAAIVSGEFAKAHEKLGRNKPVKWLLKAELTPDFVRTCFNNFFSDKEILNIKISDNTLLENGIITSIASRISKKLIGFVPLNVTYRNKEEEVEVNLLMKLKARDEEVIKGMHLIAASIDPQLSDLISQSKENLEYKNSHLKELELYAFLHDQGFTNMPLFYGKYAVPKREIYLLVQEFLDYSSLKIVNSENNPEQWSRADIMEVIKVITKLHQQVDASSFDHIQEFMPWQSKELYDKLLSILIHGVHDPEIVAHLKSLALELCTLGEEAKQIKIAKTIVHNDFNPRNICVRLDGTPIIYDWELAVVDFPHRDIVEFLSFVLPENFKQEDLLYYLKYHFSLYSNASWEEWLQAYRYSLKVYIISRLSFYEVCGIIVKYDFSTRVLTNAFRMLDLIDTYE